MSTNTNLTFRALHEQSGAFVIPNPWDIGSARILAGMGYSALATTSGGMAYSLGLPDGQVSREQVLRHCSEIVDATKLPVSADLEKGFGDTPESVFQTIIDAGAIGLAGGSIEDHTGQPDAPIYDLDLAIDRIEAASEACKTLSEDFVLTARCESLLWGGTSIDEVIKRLQAYENAGADVLFAPGLNDLSAIRDVCCAVSKPVNVVMSKPGLTFGIDDLAEAGVKRISIGSAFAQIAYGSLIAAAQKIAKNRNFECTKDAIDYVELEAFFQPTK